MLSLDNLVSESSSFSVHETDKATQKVSFKAKIHSEVKINNYTLCNCFRKP